MRPSLPVLALATLLILAPLAEAQGGYSGGSGRRNTCAPVDQDGDGLVSEQERASQCAGGSVWPFLGVAGLLGGVGLLAAHKLRQRPLPLGTRGLLNDKHTFTVTARVTYRNEDGDEWSEYLLRFHNGAEGWLEVDGADVFVHHAWPEARATLSPPVLDGQPIHVREEGTMSLVSSEGPVPEGDAASRVRYVDGETADLRDVSLEDDGSGVVAFRAYPATLGAKARIILTQSGLAKWEREQAR